jgi:structural maintenance of chromosome 4
MKPKAQTEHDEGLLEYLEDIIGTSKYKEPIEQALAEVDTLTEERTAKLNRLRHVEKDKMRLEKDKREAEGYIRLQNEWIRAKSRLWQYYIFVSLREEEKLQRQIVR